MLRINLIFRVGRRKLLLAGGVQMMAAQAAATLLIYSTFQTAAPPLYSLVLIEVVICIFTSAFCYSYGPLAWLIPTGSALQPLRTSEQELWCNCMADIQEE